MTFFRTLGSYTACLAIFVVSRAGAQLNNCRPPSGKASAVTSLDKLQGSYLLLMYASVGPKAGRIAGGTLDLAVAGVERRTSGTLYVGTASIDLARVGARFAGSLLSRDPAAPGVTLESGGPGRASGSVVFGSVRSRRADGTLSVPITRGEIAELSAKGMRGFWRTTAPNGATASGYFCATRY